MEAGDGDLATGGKEVAAAYHSGPSHLGCAAPRRDAYKEADLSLRADGGKGGNAACLPGLAPLMIAPDAIQLKVSRDRACSMQSSGFSRGTKREGVVTTRSPLFHSLARYRGNSSHWETLRASARDTTLPVEKRASAGLWDVSKAGSLAPALGRLTRLTCVTILHPRQQSSRCSAQAPRGVGPHACPDLAALQRHAAAAQRACKGLRRVWMPRGCRYLISVLQAVERTEAAVQEGHPQQDQRVQHADGGQDAPAGARRSGESNGGGAGRAPPDWQPACISGTAGLQGKGGAGDRPGDALGARNHGSPSFSSPSCLAALLAARSQVSLTNFSEKE